MGSLFKPSKVKTKSSSAPWIEQQEYLADAFPRAKDTYYKNLKELYTPLYSETQSKFMNKGTQAASEYMGVGKSLSNKGLGLTGNLNQAASKANAIDGMANKTYGSGKKYASQLQGIGNAAKGVGNEIAANGYNALNYATDASDDLRDMADDYLKANLKNTNNIDDKANLLFGNGNAKGILSDAMMLADNPYMQNQIDLAIGDIQRGFQDSQGQINAAASGAGGMNSTRAALMEAKSLEAAERAAADTTSQIRNNAYNMGLQTALGNKNSNIGVLGALLNSTQVAQNARNTAFNQNLAGVNTALTGYDMNRMGLQGKLDGINSQGALVSNAANADLSAQQAGLNAALNSNAQRINVGSIGADMAAQGAQMGLQGAEAGFNFASLPNELARQRRQERQDLVNQYVQAVGGNYGYENVNVQPGQSPFQTILGGALAVGGMAIPGGGSVGGALASKFL